jgi:hypothetical protein
MAAPVEARAPKPAKKKEPSAIWRAKEIVIADLIDHFY